MDARIVVLNGHSNRATTSSSSSSADPTSVLRLENPRPKILRRNNDYTDVFHQTPAAVESLSHVNGSVVGSQNNTRTTTGQPRIPLRFHRRTSDKTNSDVVVGGSAAAAADFYGRQHFHRPCRTSSDRTTNFGEAARHVTLHNSNFVKLKSAPPSLLGVDDTQLSSIVAAQPTRVKGHNHNSFAGASSSSIICARCGKCRCTDCAKPRKLPSKYLCNRTCLCSLDEAVDCVSCACCVKACIYHAGLENEDENDDQLYDRQQSCSSSKIDRNRSGRSVFVFDRLNVVKWICYAGACLLLPCFWCYLPLKGVSKLSSFCYSKYYDNGCRCRHQDGSTPAAKQKRSKSCSSSYRNTSSRSRSLQPAASSNFCANKNRCCGDKRLLVKSYSTGSDHHTSVLHHKIDPETMARNSRRLRCNDYVLRTPVGGHQLDTRFLCDPPS